MALKNETLNIKVKATPPMKYDPKKTAEKFGYGTAIVFILTLVLNYLQSTSEPLLDITLKSAAVGLVMAGINYFKHKEVSQ